MHSLCQDRPVSGIGADGIGVRNRYGCISAAFSVPGTHMIHCPSCKSSVDASALTCPKCGATIDDASDPTAVLSDKPRNRTAEPSADGARFATGTMLTARYRIVSLLGRGGMGEVYKAEDLKLKQIVALKFLPEALALDGAALARFHNEVRITRQISHPNVCRVYDIGEVEGLHFLSMEFIDGEDLSVLLRRIGRLPGDKAAEITRQICAGLAAAHENGVLHRDLKPANIMIDGRGRARVTDFGVAVVANELLGRQAAAGTPAYMAPEQLAGREVTQRSDIYSLGLVLYELFTGRRVFEAKSLHELMQLHEKSTPPTPSSHVKDIDPLAERVILRCLENDPKKRPASAIQVAAALPGGDPLAAALAAGETPSPEMVAASGDKTGLRPAVAIACLAAVIAGLVILVLLGNKVEWRAKLIRENSPEVLANKARDIINRLGYTDRPADHAFGLEYDEEYRRFLNEKNTPGNYYLSQLANDQPSAIFFWYRESQRYLVASRWDNGGWITDSDPPRDIAGMVNVRLDPLGRLLLFRAVPPQRDESGGTPPAPDWAALFAAAGLDQKHFTPAEPQWTPPTFSDTRAAWTGVYPNQPDIPLRIEAAAFRGKPVFFRLYHSWNKPQQVQNNQKSDIGFGIT